MSGDSYAFVVSTEGSGDFETVQGAIDAVPDFRDEETRILVRAGEYEEKVVLPASKTNVTLDGGDAEGTVLTYDDYSGKPDRFGEEIGTTGSSSCFLFGDGFTARDLTFRNSAGRVGQAVAIRVDGDRAVFENCRFVGNQDTLYTPGRDSRQYYRDRHSREPSTSSSAPRPPSSRGVISSAKATAATSPPRRPPRATSSGTRSTTVASRATFRRGRSTLAGRGGPTPGRRSSTPTSAT